MRAPPIETPITDSVAKINQELAVGEDIGFQRRWWRFERLVWVIFVALIVLDLAGAFGRGPLAMAGANSADNAVKVRYERIERSGTPSMMTITIEDAPIDQANIALFVSDTAISGLGLQRVIPAPLTTRVGDGGLTYQFPKGTLPAVVRFEFQPVSAGVYRLSVGSRRAPIDMTIAVVP